MRKKMKKQQYAVIGLGRFGGSVCKQLYEDGHEVLAIDKDLTTLEGYTEYATQVTQIDTTDEKALRSIGISNFDHVVVAIGEDIQASILTTLLLKDLGVAKVHVKAQNHYHHQVLQRIDADHIIHPEVDTGRKLARHLSSDRVVDSIELSKDYSIVELIATPKWDHKSLLDLNVRQTFGITILAIKREEQLTIAPEPETPFVTGDVLTVLGRNQDIQWLQAEGF